MTEAELLLKNKNLERVLAFTAQINSSLKLEELLGNLMTTAAEVMNSHAASLMLLDSETLELVFKVALGEKGSELKEKFRIKLGEGIAGTVAQTAKPLIVNDVKKDPRFAARFDNSTGFVTKAILCVPMIAKGRMIGVLQAINPKSQENFSENDLSLFEVFANQAAIAIENARLHEELLKQEKAKHELMIAHQIQQNFMPVIKAGAFKLDIAAKSRPARDVGGDFYDVIPLDKDRTGIIIGDVSGKGVPAALYMVRAISDYRLIAPTTTSPAITLVRLNERLAKDSHFGIFVTLLCIVVDHEKKALEFSSAGHQPMLKRSQDGKVELLESVSGPPLGLTESVPYSQSQVSFRNQDTFFLYTDGITEARNDQQKEYELERLQKAAAAPASNAEGFAQNVLKDLGQFVKDAVQHDDLTLVVFRP